MTFFPYFLNFILILYKFIVIYLVKLIYSGLKIKLNNIKPIVLLLRNDENYIIEILHTQS